MPPPQSRASGVGVALVIAAGFVFLQATGALGAARDVLLALIAAVVVLGVIFAPWIVRLVRSLTRERSERIRSQERAEVAAHLHDSVLQTLAMMQRRAGDPAEVASLARRQERELRAWLAGRPAPGQAARLAPALEAAAAEVEESHGVPVEVVVVGDRDLDARHEAVVAAAREAMTNAAKFGAGSPVDVYAESTDSRTQVFVRDRGPGFEPEAIPADRRGVRESIVGRMERHGGRARVTSAPGRGHRGGDRVGGAGVTAPRVLIVDDHQLFRAGVRAELEPLLEISGEAGSVEEAVEAIGADRPDVVLLDVHMPDGGGVEVIRRTAASTDTPPCFLALSVSDAAEDVIAVIRAGARGYVTKNISGEELADAVRRVHGGDAVFSPASRASCSTRSPAPRPSPSPSWTPSRHASARCSSTSPAATCTRRSRCASTSPRRPWRPTSPRSSEAAAVEPPRAEPLGGRARVGSLTAYERQHCGPTGPRWQAGVAKNATQACHLRDRAVIAVARVS